MKNTAYLTMLVFVISLAMALPLVRAESQPNHSISNSQDNKPAALPAAMSVSKAANVAVARPGEVITYTYRVTNTGTVSLTLTAVDDKLGPVAFISDSLALSQTTWGTLVYTVTAAPGVLTNTVTVTGTPTAGVPVVEIAVATVTIESWQTVYLPIVIKPFDPDTWVNPPIVGEALLPTKGVAAISESFVSYANAMNGSDNVSGGDILPSYPQSQWGDLTYSLVQCNFLNTYGIRRAYFEFDTSAVPDTFVSAQLVFTNSTPWDGPPEHNVAIHKGNWATLTGGDDRLLTGNWTAYETTAVTTVPGGLLGNPSGFQQMVVNLPRSAISDGGVTKLILRSTTEGTLAVSNSCYGGQPGLGGAFRGVKLHISP